MPTRCAWCTQDPQYIQYHDEEWGVPLRDDRALLELLVLEGAQAGLSWLTVLKKREAYRRAFHEFDIQRVAAMDEAEQVALLQDAGIVRNRLKIASAVRNARVVLRLQEQHGSFAGWLWAFVEGRPRQNSWRELAELPASTPLSDRISRELKREGMNFVGSTIIYAFLQAAGLVNDHCTSCFRHEAVKRLGEAPA